MSGLTLLAPIGLAALVALGLIVLIHMRRRTPPAIEIPSLRFWQPVGEDSSDKRRLRRPPITLPLVLQLLAALAIAFALARPAVQALPGLASQRTTPQHTIVILDGSTSMLALASDSGTTTRWDLARDEVDTILDDWQAGDVVSVILIGNRTESFSASTSQQVDRLRDRIRHTEAPGGIADVDAALQLAADLVLPDRANQVLVISDGAVHATAGIASAVPAPIGLKVVGDLENTLPNVAVTAIGSRPIAGRDDTYRLSFSLASFAPDAVRLPYRVQVDGADVVSSEVDLASGETRAIEVTLPQGARTADVVIDVRDSFAADNRATLLLGGSGSAGLDILLISDNPGAMERALTALPEARVDVFPTTTPGIKALAAGYDLTVFQGISPAPDDAPETPMLFVRPTPLGDLFANTGVMNAPTIDRLDAGASLLDGVDLAGVTFGDTPAYTLAEGEEELVRGTANGLTGPLIWRGEFEGHRYVVFGFDLESSNLTQRVAFPVLVARSVAEITVPPMPGTVALGDPLLYRAGERAATVSITNPSGTVTDLPAAADAGAVVYRGTGEAGVYTERELDDGDQSITEAAFVVNAGHPVESDLRPNADLAASLQGGEATEANVTERERLVDIWPMLAAIALAVVALEWLAFSGGWMRLRLPKWRLAGATGGRP